MTQVVMADQGTAALELLDDAGELDLLIAPVSGGGLIAGCATILKERCRHARAIGVVPEEISERGASPNS